MTWTIYKVIFRMESPLHSGWMKIANIQRTRLYVTGRTLWGALTARITRIMGSNDYAGIGNMVKQYLHSSYFYPCFNDRGKRPLLPYYTNEGIAYKCEDFPLKADLVEKALLTSYSSTAVNLDRLSAENASLHEIELLSHRTVSAIRIDGFSIDSGSKIYLIGYIFESNEVPSKIGKIWRSALSEIWLGGERTYGFGCVHMENICDKVSNIFGYNAFTDDCEPQIDVTSGHPVLAHTITEDVRWGELEPFFGRETDTQTGSFGSKFSPISICWKPGSTLSEGGRFTVAEFGLWR